MSAGRTCTDDPRVTDPDGAQLLEARGITKTYPGTIALDAVDFSLRAGEVHALMGENGAGKSTLIKVLTGAEQRDSGTVELAGAPIEVHDTALVGDPRQNVAPHRRILASAVVQYHDAPGPHIVDVVADRAGRVAGGPVEDRERAPGQPEARVERLDVEALAGDAEPIERIADRRRVELGRPHQVDIV
jgi:ABC-type hemin transport system ATPase subunit